MPRPADIDTYLAAQPADRRGALQKLRNTIHSLLPEVEECISYSMPGFRYRGKVVAGFLATNQGCSYFPFSGTTLGTLAAELRGYGQTKSALHFTPEKPLPVALVRKLLAARVAELGPGAAAGTSAKVKKASKTKQAAKAKATAKRPAKTKSARSARRARKAS
jgi:uncharacterized protein YdhG (YjbR/CyaY superfamily)